MSVWIAPADVVPGLVGAGAMTGGAAKLCHHSTEGSTYAGARGAYAATGNGPHFTDTFENGRYQVRQHLPLNVAATALRHPPGTGQTNRDNVIQVEHVGFAAEAAGWDPAYLAGIAGLSRQIEAATGCPSSAPYPFAPPGQAPRASWPEWHANGGHVGHAHCPYNDHVDPGALDIEAILAAPPTPQPPSQPDSPVIVVEDSAMRGTFRIVHTSKAGEPNAGCGWDAWDSGAPVLIPHATLQGPYPPDDGYWEQVKGVTVSAQPRGNLVITNVQGAPPGADIGVWVSAW